MCLRTLVTSVSSLSLLAGAVSAEADWLVQPPLTLATAALDEDGCELRLTNGLMERRFAVPGARCPAPNFATTDLTDISDPGMPPKSLLAALDVEAAVELNGARYDVGGFNNSCPRWVRTEPHVTHEEIFSTCAFLNRSQLSYTRPTLNVSAFRYVSHTTGSTVAPFPYERARHAADTPWPPAGVHLAVTFSAPPSASASIRGVNVTVHYELYQGIPAMAKWLTVAAAPDDASVVVGNVWVESLRVNDDAAGGAYPIADGWVTGVGGKQPPSLLVRTDTSHGTGCTWGTRSESTYANNRFVECSYSSHATDATTCIPDAHPADVCPGSGLPCPHCGQSACPCPAVSLAPGAFVSLADASQDFFGNSNSTKDSGNGVASFESFRATVLLLDSTDQERRGLAFRRLTKLTQPWVTENPLFFHLSETTPAGVRRTVDDAVEVGIEMIVQSFGTSWKMEDNGTLYMAAMKREIAYARSKSVEIGGYDLIDLDRAGLGYDEELIGMDGKVGGSACYASKWLDYLDPLIEQKITETGLTMIETDGPYGGGVCNSHNHTHHRGLLDSQYWQMRLQAEQYHKMRRLGVFVNAPDVYFQHGSNKMMFYGDPTQFGKPRKMDLLLSRQMIYDNSYEWITTQGWSFLPLDNYGGGSTEAKFRPLETNSVDYDLAWAQYMGMGVAGVCWRGPSIFEGPKSKAIVQKWIRFYNHYRETLTSEMLIHVRRPDGQNIDAILHANPRPGAQEQGILFAFNPTDRPITSNITVPLYYTGLVDAAVLSPGDTEKEVADESGGVTALPTPSMGETYVLRRDYSVVVTMSIPASGYSWWVVHAPSD